MAINNPLMSRVNYKSVLFSMQLNKNMVKMIRDNASNKKYAKTLQ
jgi:hypothetical protein